MNIDIWLSDKTMALLAGAIGAAALAATDWRSPWRFAQHIFVGTAASAIATPILFPAISKVLGMFSVDAAAQENSAAFITGAFAIYLFEYILAVWKGKAKQDKSDD